MKDAVPVSHAYNWTMIPITIPAMCWSISTNPTTPTHYLVMMKRAGSRFVTWGIWHVVESQEQTSLQSNLASMYWNQGR